MHIERYTVSITTAADGTGEGFIPVINGRILSIAYVKPATGGYADTVDFAVTTETSEVTIWDEDNITASKAVFPRAGTHSTAGVAALYAADGQAVNDFIYVGNERIKIAIAGGGAAGTGTFHVMVG